MSAFLEKMPPTIRLKLTPNANSLLAPQKRMLFTSEQSIRMSYNEASFVCMWE